MFFGLSGITSTFLKKQSLSWAGIFRIIRSPDVFFLIWFQGYWGWIHFLEEAALKLGLYLIFIMMWFWTLFCVLSGVIGIVFIFLKKQPVSWACTWFSSWCDFELVCSFRGVWDSLYLLKEAALKFRAVQAQNACSKIWTTCSKILLPSATRWRFNGSNFIHQGSFSSQFTH